MTAPAPRVSVVIPVYNRADCIGRTLDTVEAQTYADRETIVVDDGSTDGVADVVAARYPAVRVIRLPRNQGVSAARNRGIAAARGELVAFLDSDDLWSPEKLALQVADLDAHPGTVLAFTDMVRARRGLGDLNSDVYPPRPDRPLEQMLEGNPLHTSCVLLPRRSLERAGAFDESLRTSEDHDLWLRIAPLGPFRFLPLPLVRRVVRRDSLWFGGGGWEDAARRRLGAFLARPEGRPFRRRRRELEAWAEFRLGVLLALSGEWERGVRLARRGLGLDPLVALRRRRGWSLVAKLAGRAVGQVVGLSRLELARRLFARLDRALSRGVAPPAPAEVPAFRPPPDAPEEP